MSEGLKLTYLPCGKAYQFPRLYTKYIGSGWASSVLVEIPKQRWETWHCKTFSHITPVLRVESHRRMGTQELCRNSGEENKIKRKHEMRPMEMKSYAVRTQFFQLSDPYTIPQPRWLRQNVGGPTSINTKGYCNSLVIACGTAKGIHGVQCGTAGQVRG